MRMAACAALLLAAFGIGTAPGSARCAELALFGTVEYPAGPQDTIPQWERALAEMASERPLLLACDREPALCPNAGTRAWLGFLERLTDRTPLEQVREVNRFVNQVEYRSDAENHGRSDLWVAPSRFFAGAGDCEDYAIAKYVSLRRLGFSPMQLRLVVLRDTLRDLAHAVLAVYLDGQIYVLDNLAADALPQTAIDHYQPYYSLNELGHWIHAPEAVPTVAAGRAQTRH